MSSGNPPSSPSSTEHTWEDIFTNSPWTTLAAGVTVACLGYVLAKMKKSSASSSKEDKLKPAPQRPKEVADTPRPPGKGAALFTGVRVVDLSTHVAGPTVARVMADLGAEVVHVEVPSGDLFRYTLLDFEGDRKFCTLFDITNPGKHSVQLDLKSDNEVERLHKLLDNADVLVTNMRTEPLRRLNLDYDTTKKKHPSLIYAQVSAWGLEGPDAAAPGYDIGAFYATSGMSATLQPKDRKQAYPPGFGDLTTGQMLLGGVAMGLKQRLQTGHGVYVNSTLLRTGMWTMASQILKSKSDPEAAKDGEVPDYSRAYFKDCNAFKKPYMSSDGIVFYLTPNATDVQISDKLDAAFKLESTGENGENAWNEEKLTAVFSSMNYETIKFHLCQVLLDHSKLTNPQEMTVLRTNKDYPGLESVYEYPKFDMDGLTRIPRPPYTFSCSNDHRVRFRAPEKGAHTDTFLTEGWSEIHPSAALPTTTSIANSGKKPEECDPHRPLSGLVVIELSSGLQQTCSAATSLLADHGAQVVKVERASDWGESLRTSHPALFANLNRGKRSVALNLESAEGKSALMDMVLHADVLVTDLTAHQRRALSMDDEVLLQLNPSLVVSILDAYPEGNPRTFESVRFESPMYIESGVGYSLAPKGGFVPPHVFELIAAPYLFSSISCALFHRERTGEGQVVKSNAFHIGMWLNQLPYAWVDRQPDFLDSFVLGDTDRETRLCTPTPVYNSYTTKDGMELMLLGLDTKRHLGKVAKALGIQWTLYPKIIWSVLTKVIPRRKETNLVKKLQPVIQTMCSSVDAGIESMTYAEIKEAFAKYDVWYCPVRVPSQLLSMEQAHAIGSFVYEEHKNMDDVCYIGNPVEISDKLEHATKDQHKHVKAPPAFDEAHGISIDSLRK